MLLTLPTSAFTNIDDKFIIVTENDDFSPFKQSFHPHGCDTDDSSISSDYTAETSSSTITNDSCDDDIMEAQNDNTSEDTKNEKLSQKTRRDSAIEELFLLFENGDLLSANDNVCIESETNVLSLEGLNIICFELQNIAFEMVLLGHKFLNNIRANGKLLKLRTKSSNGSCPEKEEMEIQFVYMIVDEDGKKSIVKSSTDVRFPSLHQMPGCCLKDIINKNNSNIEKHTEVVRKESTVVTEEEEKSNLLSAKQHKKSSSFLKTLRNIYTQISRTAFLKMNRNNSNVDKSSVTKDDDKLRSEEMEIQFVDIPMWKTSDCVIKPSVMKGNDTPLIGKLDSTTVMARAA